MISNLEETSLKKVEQEQDFYAPLMFLCLCRLWRAVKETVVDENEIADIVLDSYKDIQERHAQ